MAERKVALVSGASRGIGKVCAIYLARAGFDVAVTARTVNPGEAREHSSTLRASNTKVKRIGALNPPIAFRQSPATFSNWRAISTAPEASRRRRGR